MDPSTSDVIPCNGPCRKRFRPTSVGMNEATANFLLASAKDPGLRWLCPACRQSDEGTGPASKLPPELWMLIFRNLDNRSMLQVRLTCHRWKDIVDSNRALRRGFQIEIKGYTVDEGYCPENLPPAAVAWFAKSEIITVDAWWPAFGHGLTELGLFSCKIALRTVLGMLRETPNLVDFYLEGMDYTSVEEEEVNFRLENLKYFRCDSFFEVFANMFPRLAELYVRNIPELDEQSICHLLQSVQGTLTDLICCFTPFMLEQIAGMAKLRLTKTLFSGDEIDTAVQLSRIQTSIEDITIYVRSAVHQELSEIGRNLTKLKKLDIAIQEDVDFLLLSFLAEMPFLTRLNLQGDMDNEQQLVDFERSKNQNLLYLRIYQLCFFPGSLQHYLTNCPQLQEIDLDNCFLDSWDDIFAIEFKSLRLLKLNYIDVTQTSTSLPDRQWNTLKELQISSCEIPKELLIQIVLQCPTVENLSFSYVESVNDELVQVLDRLPYLKKLKLDSNALTDDSVNFITQNCSHLQNVDISGFRISKAARRRLRAMAQTR